MPSSSAGVLLYRMTTTQIITFLLELAHPNLFAFGRRSRPSVAARYHTGTHIGCCFVVFVMVSVSPCPCFSSKRLTPRQPPSSWVQVLYTSCTAVSRQCEGLFFFLKFLLARHPTQPNSTQPTALHSIHSKSCSIRTLCPSTGREGPSGDPPSCSPSLSAAGRVGVACRFRKSRCSRLARAWDSGPSWLGTWERQWW